MDNLDSSGPKTPVKPPGASQASGSQPVTQPASSTAAKLDVSDEAAKALLAINNLQVAARPKIKPSMTLVITVITLIILVILASFLVGGFKQGGSSSPSSSVGVPTQSDPTNGNDTTQQINQDVKECSNPVNAASVC